MSTYGNSTAVVTLTPKSPNVTLAGTIDAYGTVGLYRFQSNAPQLARAAVIGPKSGHFTIVNTGTVLSAGTAMSASAHDYAILLGANGTVSNSGEIIAGSGIGILGTAAGAAIVNTGTIEGTASAGIYLQGQGDIVNSGDISGDKSAISLAAGGYIGNRAGGVITGSTAEGVNALGVTTLNNAGLIYGLDVGVRLRAGGSINNAGSIIQGYIEDALRHSAAIEFYDGGSLTNSGTIAGGSGVSFENLQQASLPSYLKNRGDIAGQSTYGVSQIGTRLFFYYGFGVYSGTAGKLINSGTITGVDAGVVFNNPFYGSRATGIVKNSGLIESSAGYGVYLQAGGTLTNSGTIIGELHGVKIDGAINTIKSDITNSGLIEAPGIPAGLPFGSGATISTGLQVSGTGTITNTGTIAALYGKAVEIFTADDFGGDVAPSVLLNSGLIAGLYGVAVVGRAGLTQPDILLANSGTVAGTDFGIGAFTGTIRNTGLIEATGTSFTAGSGTTAASGILLQSGGFVTNAAHGTITAPNGVGINLAGVGYDAQTATSYVYNYGLINAATAISLQNGGYVYNAKHATIQGGSIGIGAATLANANAGQPIVIYNYGDISGASFGVSLAAPAYVYNAGTIAGRYGVVLFAGGSVDNTGLIEGVGTQSVGLGIIDGIGYNYGTLAAPYIGVLIENGVFYNSAKITATGSTSAGMELLGTSVAYNYKGASIVGAELGVALESACLTNDGLIAGGQFGAYLIAGATLLNAGTLEGGVLLDSATLIESGLLKGNGTFAVSIANPDAGALILDPGATIDGAVILDGGALEIGAQGQRTVTIAASQFSGIGALTIDAGATVDLAGTLTVGGAEGVLNQGLLREAKGDALTIEGSILGAGTIDLGAQTTLTLAGSVGANQKIAFTGKGETLDLTDPTDFTGTLRNFAAGDTLDLSGLSLSSIESLAFVGGVLTIAATSGTYDITFANPASFKNETFASFADGAGTGLTLRSITTMALSTQTDFAALSANLSPANNTVAVTLSPNHPSIVESGVIDAYGTFVTGAGATYHAALYGPAGTSFTLKNTGTIISPGTSPVDFAVLFASAGTITNSGTLEGGSGLAILGTTAGALVRNTGLIEGSLGGGVDLLAGGIVANGNSGIIRGGAYGIGATAYAAVYNYGHISGASAILLGNGGYVYNAAGATIKGGDIGITALTVSGAVAAHIDVYNYGNISARTIGMSLNAAAYVYNAGTVSAQYGVLLFGGGSVDNTGIILGVGTQSVALAVLGGIAYNYGTLSAVIAGAEIVNGVLYNYGAVKGGEAGLLAENAVIYNSANITASGSYAAIEAFGSVSLYNYESGRIVGSTLGVVASENNFISNAGLISAGSIAVALQGSTLVNTGTLLGGALLESGTVENAGLIKGNGTYAVTVTTGDASSSLLVIEAGSTIEGAVMLNGGALEVAAQGHTIVTIAARQFSGIGALTIDAGATVELAGTLTVGGTTGVLNAGLIQEAKGDALTIDGSVLGAGTIALGAKTTLALTGSVGVDQKIAFTGSGETLDLADPAGVAGKLQNFAAGDTIDLTGLSSIDSLAFAGGILTITAGSGTYGLTFANPASFKNETFASFADGAGTGITLTSTKKMGFLAPATQAHASPTALPALSLAYAGSPGISAAPVATPTITNPGPIASILLQTAVAVPTLTLHP